MLKPSKALFSDAVNGFTFQLFYRECRTIENGFLSDFRGMLPDKWILRLSIDDPVWV